LATADARLLTIAPWLRHPQAIRAVFFDVGFTLLRPYPSLRDIVRATCAAQGMVIDDDALAAHAPAAEQYFFRAQHVQKGTWGDNAAINRAWMEYFTLLLEPFVAEPQRSQCAAAVLLAFDQHSAWRPYADVQAALATLSARYTLGLISDWGIGLGPILREHDLLRYFGVLVVSATSRRAKPDPHLFETALQRADALGDYTVYVGDSYVQDVLGARAAGIHPILIDRRKRHDPAQIDCPVIHALDELVALLASA
jgi:HAD superfamily hydrolase (TIGR01549 family)